MTTPEELINKMRNIEYGWIDKNKERHEIKIIRAEFEKNWYLQNPSDLEKTKLGVCWDQVEYERNFFEEKGIPYKTIFMIYDTGVKKHMHTFLVYKEKKNYCWIENTYEHYKGINKYSTFKELLDNVMKDFLIYNKLLIIGENIKYYMYDRPEYGINCEEFIKNATEGTLLEKDYSNLDL